MYESSDLFEFLSLMAAGLCIPRFVLRPAPTPPAPQIHPSPSFPLAPTSKQIVQLDKDLPHINGLHQILEARRSHSHQVICVSLDLEVHDQDHDTLLEVGISVVKIGARESEHVTSHHFIILEHEGILNGKYCENNKYNFLPEFGVSEWVDMSQLRDRLDTILRSACDGMEDRFIIGHSIQGDLEWLEKLSIDIRPYNMQPCDIARCYRHLITGDSFVSIVGMENMMRQFGMNCLCPHNGGNDARYNIDMMFAVMEMMSKMEKYLAQ